MLVRVQGSATSISLRRQVDRSVRPHLSSLRPHSLLAEEERTERCLIASFVAQHIPRHRRGGVMRRASSHRPRPVSWKCDKAREKILGIYGPPSGVSSISTVGIVITAGFCDAAAALADGDGG